MNRRPDSRWGRKRPQTPGSFGAHVLTIVLGAIFLSTAPAGCGSGGTGGAGGGSGGESTVTSSSSSTGGGNPGPCMDGKVSPGETDVDCGGACPRCADGKKCTSPSDCTSSACIGGVCVEPECTDKVKDGKESDVDCGGSCPACPDGKSCSAGTDCMNSVCTAGVCQAATCKDSVKNGTESGTDCGGTCPHCPDGQPCGGGADCVSTLCQAMVCQSNVVWADGAGDAAAQSVAGVAIDAMGNTLIAGSFHGSIDLGGGALASAGGSDIFVAKLDGAGKHVWSKRFGDAADQTAGAVAVDAMGEVWLTGAVTGTVDFGGGPLANAADPLTDVFLASLSSSGAYVSAKRFNATLAQRGTALAINASGAMALGGVFDGTVDLGCGLISSAGGGDVFLARLDTTGPCIYSKRFGDAAPQELAAAAVDATGNVVLGGRFQGAVSFGGAPLSMMGGTFGAFVAKLDPTGAHLFSTSFGNSMNAQEVQGAAFDANGNVFVSGVFSGSLVAGNITLNSAGGSDLFVVKLDPGGAAVWGLRFGDAADQVGPLRVGADDKGNVVVAGTLQGAADFGGGSLASVGSDDVVVAKLDASGNHQWSVRYGDAGSQQATALATSGSTSAVLGGAFQGSPDIGGKKLTSAGDYDALVMGVTTP
jgi:hypothetical protein